MAPPDWKQYRPDDTPDPDRPAPGSKAPAPYRPPAPPKPIRSVEERTVRRTGPRAVAVGIAGVLVAGCAWGAFAVVRNATEPDQPQTAEGFAAMLVDLREETGGTQVFEAVLYPGYGILDVPVSPGDVKQISYRWDGGLDEWTKGTSDDEAFDLADVSGEVLDGLCAHTRDLVDDPGDCYLIISKPDATDPKAGWISAYTSNEFSQGGYIEYDLEGNEVERHTW
ncbi:hypothetical protein FHP29_12670 [Nocardioides albidus]|uniref:Uncharacterized protein n=1 Tax=Nocardioides albidus TaxID=1517589 RepID=A0A5C4VV17_9ACTN|nr:hypothetical protein [Nocardioides albidus]TNM39713.1 hypothetical protein FHP29_12670 [Nocardioides albidus]